MATESTKKASASPSASKKRRRTTSRAKTATPKAKKAKGKKDPDAPEETSSALLVSPPPSRVLIVDNGGDTLKYGWMEDYHKSPGGSEPFPHSIPNVSARLAHQFTTLVGDELNKVQNPNSLLARTRSTERGIICNLENQTKVWKRMLDLLGVAIPIHTITAKCLGWNATNVKKKANSTLIGLPEKTIPSHMMAVVLLLPPHYPRILLDQILTVWMEDFGVSHVGLGISSAFASHDQSLRSPYKTSCTVDLGWSSTLIVPTFSNNLILAHQNTSSDKTPKTTLRRLPIGGRHMINMLKYYMSYRQYNLMDQEVLMRDVFERLSYVTMNMKQDLKLARLKTSGRRVYDRDFVLPDYTNTKNGEIRIPLALQRDLEREKEQRQKNEDPQNDEDDDEEDEDFEGDDDDDDEDENDNDEDFGEDENRAASRKKRSNQNDGAESEDEDDDEEESMEERRKRLLRERAEEERRKKAQEQEEQLLRVSLERFVVPEVLFRPADAGLQSDLVGLAQAIVMACESCPEYYRPALYRSVYLVGGIARLPNILERLERELRCLVPTEYKLELCLADSPVDRAWFGAKAYFETEPYTKWTVSRQEWEKCSKRKAYKKLLIENGGCYI